MASLARAVVLMTLIGALLDAVPASACPLCHTDTAAEVRALLRATARDPSVLTAAALPFLAIGAIVSVLQRGASRPAGESTAEDKKHD